MEIDSIIARLGEIGSRCDAEADRAVCTEAANIIHDYNGLAKQYQEMYRRLGVADHVVRKDGIWHCPSCNRRANQYHSYGHSCGQKLDWGIGKVCKEKVKRKLKGIKKKE